MKSGERDVEAIEPVSSSKARPTDTASASPSTGGLGPESSASTNQGRETRRYEILGEHGRGGLGRVFRAYDRELGRDVAIKELLSHDYGSELRFLREVQITARLEHPGIVPVHEAGRWHGGTPYYAMKLVAGRPLRDLIAERTTVSERIQLLHHVIAVADAMAYAHDRNIIHRDLKPANVIIGDFGETIVIDWGLAKDLRVREDRRSDAGPDRLPRSDDLTTVGSILGTPAYMAPEQERGEDVDQRADVFAIGAMLWELCSLHRVPPTEARHRHRMLRRAGIDQDLIAIIDKTLDRDRLRRYPHAGALAADLTAFKSGARISARDYSLFAVFAHWVRRHRALAFSIASFIGLLIASVVALALLYRSSRSSEQRANDALAESWVQRGQRELFAGEYVRALPYLAQAYRMGDHSLAIRAMLHRAIAFADQPRIRLSLGVAYTEFRAGGREAMVVGSAGDAVLLDTISGRVLARLPEAPPSQLFRPVHVSEDGSVAAVAREGAIIIWDGIKSRSIPQHQVPLTRNTRLAFSGSSEIAIIDANIIV